MIANSIAIALTVSGVFYAGSLLFFWRLSRQMDQAGVPLDHSSRVLLRDQSTMMTEIFFVTSALATVIISVWGLYITHRIAGPIYRLEAHCRQMAQGEAHGPVRFREGDFFPELAEAFNAQLKRSGPSLAKSNPTPINRAS